jgi:hypothetical protein
MDEYFIEYELREKRNYKKIITELEAQGAIRMLNSYWCLKKNNTSAESLRNHFIKYLDNDDGLVVAKIIDWAMIRAENTPNDI